MKEKVKDLDPVLRGVLFDQLGNYGSIEDNDGVASYFDRIDWKKCTGKQRLKYAELMYPVGTKFKTHFSRDIDTIKKLYLSTVNIGDVCAHCELENARIIYNSTCNKWAEIISRPDEKEETMDRINNYFENTNPEQIKKDWEETKEPFITTGDSKLMAHNISLSTEPEFQPGEMVEWSDESLNPIMYWCSGIWTGGRTKAGAFIIETEENDIKKVRHIRKIQPDPEKEIMTKVAQLKSKYVKGTACSGKGGTNSPYKIYDYMFEDNGLDEMLIEALKTEVK